MITFADLTTKFKEYNENEIELKKLTKAYLFAENKHNGQYRKSGEPYIVHPLNTAYNLVKIHADCDTICAALLHDTLEDTNATFAELEKEFNEDVAKIVDGVTKIKYIDTFKSEKDLKDFNNRKLLNSLNIDVRSIIVKLSDRLNNMQTLEYQTPYKQKEKAVETLGLFVPLAKSLGIYVLKDKLEDLSLKYLKPKDYNDIESKLLNSSFKNKKILEEMLSEISSKLNDYNIPNNIKIDFKNIYGIYKQLQNGKKFADITNLRILKIIVKEFLDCYKSLGLIHSLYTPYKITDYIAQPKTNLYQSLHTKVFAPDEKMVQCQIKTDEMNRFANLGICAFYEDNANLQTVFQEKFGLPDSIKFLNESINDNKIFISKVKAEILTSNIYVHTPNGDIIELPKNATPVDFAYKIHSDIGNNISGALVNGKEVSLDYNLKNGDRVKIIVKKSPTASKKLMKNAKTYLAKNKIKDNLN